MQESNASLQLNPFLAIQTTKNYIIIKHLGFPLHAQFCGFLNFLATLKNLQFFYGITKNIF